MRILVLLAALAAALAERSLAWVASPLHPYSASVGTARITPPPVGFRMRGSGLGGEAGGAPPAGLARLRDGASGLWAARSAAAVAGGMAGGLRVALAAAETEGIEYEDVEGAVGAAAGVVDAVAESAGAPDLVKLAAKAVVAVGVVIGLGILYVPPNIQTIETIEVNPAVPEEREALVDAIEKLTGEEFPGRKNKDS